MLGWRHQLVSQCKILLIRKFLKFHRNLLKGFRVSLKLHGLAMPNEHCQAVIRKGEAVLGDIVRQEISNLCTV